MTAPSSATPQDDTGRIRQASGGEQSKQAKSITEVEFAKQLHSLIQQFRDFQIQEQPEPYSYDFIGFDEWLEFDYRVNDMATDHSDPTTEQLKAAPSPTIDTELDGILRNYREVCFKVRDNKPSIDGLAEATTQAKADYKALIERETARARIDELERLNFQEASGFLSGGNMILRQSVVTKRIAALTSPPERKKQ